MTRSKTVDDQARMKSWDTVAVVGVGLIGASVGLALRERGLAGSAIDLALEEADENWYALARDVRLKKFGPDTPIEFKEKARQMRFLQSRGFEPDQIQAAVSSDGVF